MFLSMKTVRKGLKLVAQALTQFSSTSTSSSTSGFLKSNTLSRSFVYRGSTGRSRPSILTDASTSSPQTSPTAGTTSTTTTTYTVPVIDMTSSEASGPCTDTTLSSTTFDLPPIVEHEMLLPSKWFARLPSHFVLSLLDLLSPANALVLSDVDRCMNDFIKEHEEKFFLPEKNSTFRKAAFSHLL